jgi:ribosomal protein S18 acetylase RimI-like enzyme
MANFQTPRNAPLEKALELAHLNLIQFARESTAWAGGSVDERDDVLTFEVPVTAPLLNGVHRLGPGASAELIVARGLERFASRGRSWSIWLRDNPLDHRLRKTAVRAGLKSTGTAPAMGTAEEIGEIVLPPAVTVTRAVTASDFQAFWAVNEVAFAGTGHGGPLARVYCELTGMKSSHIYAVVSRHRGKPVGTALSLHSGAVAGVYWVGVVPEYRRMGIGKACTAVVTRAAQRAGAEMVILQSSPAGLRIYEKLGFRTLFNYETMTWNGPTPSWTV